MLIRNSAALRGAEITNLNLYTRRHALGQPL